MADIDLDSLSVEELVAHRADVDRALARAEARRRDDALAAARAAAEEHGFRLEEILNEAPAKKPARKAPVKFRHPDNADLTWAGRGRRPAWLEQELDAGKSLDDFRVS